MNQDLSPPSIGEHVSDIVRTEEGFHILTRLGVSMPPASLVHLIAEMSSMLSRVS